MASQAPRGVVSGSGPVPLYASPSVPFPACDASVTTLLSASVAASTASAAASPSPSPCSRDPLAAQPASAAKASNVVPPGCMLPMFLYNPRRVPVGYTDPIYNPDHKSSHALAKQWYAETWGFAAAARRRDEKFMAVVTLPRVAMAIASYCGAASAPAHYYLMLGTLCRHARAALVGAMLHADRAGHRLWAWTLTHARRPHVPAAGPADDWVTSLHRLPRRVAACVQTSTSQRAVLLLTRGRTRREGRVYNLVAASSEVLPVGSRVVLVVSASKSGNKHMYIHTHGSSAFLAVIQLGFDVRGPSAAQ